jgi:hypothetical protein
VRVSATGRLALCWVLAGAQLQLHDKAAEAVCVLCIKCVSGGL